MSVTAPEQAFTSAALVAGSASGVAPAPSCASLSPQLPQLMDTQLAGDVTHTHSDDVTVGSGGGMQGRRVRGTLGGWIPPGRTAGRGDTALGVA